MSDVVIKVENLTKEYRLGQINHGMLSKDLQAWWAKKRGKEDPNSRIEPSSQLTPDPSLHGKEGGFYALKDINFEVKQGEVLGIIGANGAGKSTLLKILSRVTSPTSGSVKIKGRIGSLLEVGTGFHPELTGRENIYLNGAILGMKKWEIDRKLDEIIDFSGVEKFVDTPVKRYSSGMYVRLAFAVAAHLDPEILVVDEVLAVGDAEFQKKCLGKMGDISKKEGRTVLFVSHNMAAVRQLCGESMVISNGIKTFFGETDRAVDWYLNSGVNDSCFVNFTFPNAGFERYGNREYLEIISLKVCDESGRNIIYVGSEVVFFLKVKVKKNVSDPELGICISNLYGSRFHHFVSKWDKSINSLEPGIYMFRIYVDKIMLYPGSYKIATWARAYVSDGSDDFIENAMQFKVDFSENLKNLSGFGNFKKNGGVFLPSKWELMRDFSE